MEHHPKPRIIIFGPHPDDQEIGMGGTIAKLAHQGHDVLIADVTDGSPTPRGDRSTRLPEAQTALAALQPSPEAISQHGARPITRVLLDLPNRMVEHTLATRHLFAGAIRAWQAQIVFTPWPEDAHPDHRAVTRAVEDARFDAKLTKIEMPLPKGFAALGEGGGVGGGRGDAGGGGGMTTLPPPIYPKWLFYYHVSHLRATITPSFVMDITGFEEHKSAAIRAYRSQFGPFDDHAKSAFAPGDPKAQATTGRLVSGDIAERMLEYGRYMGGLIGTRFGEPFMTKEPVGLGSLGALMM